MYITYTYNVYRNNVKLKKQNNKCCFKIFQDDFICLVPELCNLTGLTNKMTSDFKLTRTLQKYTTITPGVRQKALIELVNSVNGILYNY